MKIGIFFGGQSREREVSFAGGRTVFDNLNKSLFEALPIFVDSVGNFILLDWQYIYKGTIRDFYPPANFLPESPGRFQVYAESLTLSRAETDRMISEVGRRIEPSEFSSLFDFAFLALHGPYGEDGNIQGLLEWYDIPYSGSGILPSAIGIDKAVQKKLMEAAGFPSPGRALLHKDIWLEKSDRDKDEFFSRLSDHLGWPIVVKSPHQGSSIGITIVEENNYDKLRKAIEKSFFRTEIRADEWNELSADEKRQEVATLTDIREGIGLPVETEGRLVHLPDELLTYLDTTLGEREAVMLTSAGASAESIVLFESFIKGREFSCIVIQDEKGEALALPPTEIRKYSELFDYRSKYLPGMSRKITPIDTDPDTISRIRQECCRLFDALNCNVYARIDGYLTEDGSIYLNDPNTTSGMLPSSFFFHQAAEIGLNPSQFLTYLVRTSLSERAKDGKSILAKRSLMARLDEAIQREHAGETERIRVAVIMGGFSSERHISVESGRNIFEKLSSSTVYEPFPVFLTGTEENHELYLLPVNIMLKDNADDISEKVKQYSEGKQHPVLAQIIDETATLRHKYTGGSGLTYRTLTYEELKETVGEVFIALHGRPGEDGSVQQHLERVGLPYNGSGVASSQTTINKYRTNEILRKNGISVSDSRLVWDEEWAGDLKAVLEEASTRFGYPLIAKPADDGCSSAVKKIRNEEELVAFGNLVFRDQEPLMDKEAGVLKLKPNEEFPIKRFFMLEKLIDPQGAHRFLEITGGLLTRYDESGRMVYEVFEPSEALAMGDLLSLEEKFLAGEGQNITPARYAPDKDTDRSISEQVRADLEKVARVLNVEGYARIDAFVRITEDGKAETIIIEINSLPGMTPATCIFHQAALNGYKPYEFIDSILTFGRKRLQHDTANGR
ncbi:MAG: D-alanine--D-alanine ligase [Cyclobacteriaceae bacterium]